MSIIVGAAMGGRLASIDALSLVFQAGWVVQLVLLVLLTLSVVSWTIIVYKWRKLRLAGQDSETFLEVYQEGSLDSAYSRARDLNRSPLASIYATAYAELSRMQRFAGKGAVEERHLQALARHIGWAGSREGLRLERGLNFLATTGSAADEALSASPTRQRTSPVWLMRIGPKRATSPPAVSEPNMLPRNEPPWRRSRPAKRRTATSFTIAGVMKAATSSSETTTMSGVESVTTTSGASHAVRFVTPRPSSQRTGTLNIGQVVSATPTASMVGRQKK